MNSRQRVQLTLNHQEPDRVPFDLGSSMMSGIHIVAYRNLRAYLGLPTVEPRLADMIQQIVEIDPDVRDRLRIDVQGLMRRGVAHFTQPVAERGEYTQFYDEWGTGWMMPREGGLYYDMTEFPLAHAETVADVERHRWPDPTRPARFQGLRERAQQAAEVEGQAVFIGSLCAGIMEMATRFRGFERFFADLVENEALAVALMTKVMELKIAYWERVLAQVGDLVDVVGEADDLGGQTRMLISPAMYRRLVKPLHRQLFDFIHARSRAKVFFHTDGAVRPVLPDLIEIGVDILNPLQMSAAGMETAGIKRDFGRDLTFWGGGVDTQAVLAGGTPQQVRDEVRRRIDDLAPGGGFVFGAVHNIQADVPPENIMALWETLQEFGDYA